LDERLNAIPSPAAKVTSVPVSEFKVNGDDEPDNVRFVVPADGGELSHWFDAVYVSTSPMFGDNDD
jgi:hypothetical protein